MDHAYDAIVIGGGPAGATAGLLLARAGWRVAIVEKAAFPRRKVCGEYLSPTNLPLLAELGVADEFTRQAGPDIRRVGLFARGRQVVAPLPCDAGGRYGRALPREQLDALLLARAAAEGAAVHQPCAVTQFARRDGQIHCNARSNDETFELRGPVLVAAHGSWEAGALPTQPPRRPARASDLFGFKAHFSAGALPADLMPLLAFPGGYGGMVHVGEGLFSLSCCVRRDRLDALRRAWPDLAAGDAVLRHITRSCDAAAACLATARREGRWLSCGPIRPGFRTPAEGPIFRAGNAAAEAHPVIAEGISMAIQSAALLAAELSRLDPHHIDHTSLDDAGRRYATAWRRAFGARIRTAAVIARWAMHPLAVGASLPIIRSLPRLLTVGALLAGKAARPLAGLLCRDAPAAIP